MTISDELLQMIEKMSEKPDKKRIITTARVGRFPRSLTGGRTSPKHESEVDPAVRQRGEAHHHGKRERLDHKCQSMHEMYSREV